MSYKAYRDSAKTQIINAENVTVNDVGGTFYCHTKDCTALMHIVNAGDPDHAFFRRNKTSPPHSSAFCSADGKFDPTRYEESRFNFENICKKLLDDTGRKTGKEVGKGTSPISGGGGEKSLSTVYQIYCMCRKYEQYNGYLTNKILADERSYSYYKDEISGHKLVQCTPYHKVYKEYSYKMNYPSFPFANRKHLKINFESENLFWNYYHKFKDSNHKNLIVILGDWTPCNSGSEYIAECTIYRGRQIYLLGNSDNS